KLGYSPIIARPRSLFAREYVSLRGENAQSVLEEYSEFFRRVAGSSLGDIYFCDLKALWENRYVDQSFAEFKYRFHSKDPSLRLPFLDKITPVLQIEVTLRERSMEAFLSRVAERADRIAEVFSGFHRSRGYFSLQDLALKMR